MNDFFARPWLLVLAPVIFWLLRQLKPVHLNFNAWEARLPPNLARRLLRQDTTVANRLQYQAQPGFWLVMLTSLLLTLYLAGPGWPLQQKLQQPAQEVVLIQQLLPLTDQDKRGQVLLETSQRLLVPFFNHRSQGKTALIFYAGSAHLASPMTPDAASLRQLLSLAHPSVMPLAGDRPEAAFQLAARSGQQPGQATTTADRLYWVWITARPPTQATLARLLTEKPEAAELAILLTQPENPLQERLPDSQAAITWLTPATAGPYLQTLNQNALASTRQEAASSRPAKNSGAEGVGFEGLGFQEQGHWFLLPAALLLLWQFFGQPWPVHRQSLQASGWVSLLLLGWLLQDPYYQGSGWFQYGDFTKAAEAFTQALPATPAATPKHEDLLFNAGTAWLFAGKPEQALTYLQRLRQLAPEREDACINQQLAQRLQQGQALPSTQASLRATCRQQDQPDEEKKPEQSARAPAVPEKPATWQPQIQMRLLEELQDDPWRLLRRRFEQELRSVPRETTP